MIIVFTFYVCVYGNIRGTEIINILHSFNRFSPTYCNTLAICFVRKRANRRMTDKLSALCEYGSNTI